MEEEIRKEVEKNVSLKCNFASVKSLDVSAYPSYSRSLGFVANGLWKPKAGFPTIKHINKFCLFFFPLLLPPPPLTPQFGALCWHLNSCAVNVNVPPQSGSTPYPLCTSINYLAGFQTAAIRPTPSTLSLRCCFLFLSYSLNLKGHCTWKRMIIFSYGKYNTTCFFLEKPEMLEQPCLPQNYCSSVSHPVWNQEFQKGIK